MGEGEERVKKRSKNFFFEILKRVLTRIWWGDIIQLTQVIQIIQILQK